ncbi:MAG: hypothetical protein ACPG4Z_04610 [Chitinophagales bacterium]
MNELTKHLLPFEVVLLFMGAFLFLLVCVAFMYFIFKDKKLMPLIPFFIITIVMVGFPSYKSIRLSKDNLELTKYENQYIENPTDTTAAQNYFSQIEKMKTYKLNDADKNKLNLSEDFAKFKQIEAAYLLNPLDDSILLEYTYYVEVLEERELPPTYQSELIKANLLLGNINQVKNDIKTAQIENQEIEDLEEINELVEFYDVVENEDVANLDVLIEDYHNLDIHFHENYNNVLLENIIANESELLNNDAINENLEENNGTQF